MHPATDVGISGLAAASSKYTAEWLTKIHKIAAFLNKDAATVPGFKRGRWLATMVVIVTVRPCSVVIDDKQAFQTQLIQLVQEIASLTTMVKHNGFLALGTNCAEQMRLALQKMARCVGRLVNTEHRETLGSVGISLAAMEQALRVLVDDLYALSRTAHD